MTPVDKQLTPPGGWNVADGPYIAPLTNAQLKPWERAFVWIGLKVRFPNSANRGLPAVFALLMRHRKLFYGWIRFAAKLMPGGTLSRQDTELVILRVGWNCRCRYEWGQHVEIGLRSGVTPAEIARVAQGPDASGWQPRQAVLLRAVDELHADRRIAKATWQALTEHYKDRQLIELPMLAGHYEMLAGLLNSAALPLDASVEEALGRAPIHGA